MKEFFARARSYIFRGILAIIPICLCLLAIRLLYVLIDKKVMAFLSQFIDIRQIPGLGVVLVLASLYLIGLTVSNVIGGRIFRLIDRIFQQIPVIKTIYQIIKEFSEGLTVPKDKQTFQKVVLVDWNHKGQWVVGFVTGQYKNRQTNETLLRVYMPHAPNPVAGFVFVVKESQTMDPQWSVEETLKVIVSAGLVSPGKIG